jgi:hypothetical protein
MFGTNNAASADGTAAPEFSPQQVAGAVSKLISATIGDCAVVFSRSQAHKLVVPVEWLPMSETKACARPRCNDYKASLTAMAKCELAGGQE